jgi:hypothetical protein
LSEPNYLTHSSLYLADEGTDCDGSDNDCDGSADEGCVAAGSFSIGTKSTSCAAGDDDVIVMHLEATSTGGANTLTDLTLTQHSAGMVLTGDVINFNIYRDGDKNGVLNTPTDTLLAGPVGLTSDTTVTFTGMSLALADGTPEDLLVVADAGANPSYLALQLTAASDYTLSTAATKSLATTPVVGGVHSIAPRLCVVGSDGFDDRGPGTQGMELSVNYKDLDVRDATWETDIDGVKGKEDTIGLTSDCLFHTAGHNAGDSGTLKDLKIKDKGVDSEYLHIYTPLPLGLPIPTSCDLFLTLYGSDDKSDPGNLVCHGAENFEDFTTLNVYPYATANTVGTPKAFTIAGTNSPSGTTILTDVAAFPVSSANGCDVDLVELEITSLYGATSTNSNLELRVAIHGADNTEVKSVAEIHLSLE